GERRRTLCTLHDETWRRLVRTRFKTRNPSSLTQIHFTANPGFLASLSDVSPKPSSVAVLPPLLSPLLHPHPNSFSRLFPNSNSIASPTIPDTTWSTPSL